MEVHLIDGTYELFRHYFAVPARTNSQGAEVGAVRGVLNSLIGLLSDGATHVGVATDHVIESFRNDMYSNYKDGSEIDPVLFAQFPLLELALESAGFVVWPMVDFEADDALAAAAAMASEDHSVDRVLVCTPDKDLAQCVGGKVVQFDRRKSLVIDRQGVIDKFGVPPESIPDYLALVGDSADGFPGMAGWGAKSSATVLAHYGHIEDIPEASGKWEVGVRSAQKLAQTLAENKQDALLFKQLATLSCDAPVSASVQDLRWTGPSADTDLLAQLVDDHGVVKRLERLAGSR